MPRVVVIDACVLYSAALRDLFLRLARSGFFSLRWSDRILDEMVLALTRTRPDIPIQRLGRLKAIMIEAFPRAMVDPALLAPLGLPDSADEHVIAVAVACSADLLVTHNLRDFPAQTVARATSARVVSPDELLVQLLAEDEAALRSVVDDLAAGLRNPPIAPERLIEGLRAQVPRFAEAYGRLRL
jgi:predicted nucleic acid-binding protein